MKNALEEQQKIKEEIQGYKAKIEKVEDWRSQKVIEIRDLRDRAKNRDYHGYRRLRNYDTGSKPPGAK